MSNRNIVITIVIILLVAVGIWGVIRVRNNSKVASENTAADSMSSNDTTATDQTTAQNNNQEQQSMNNDQTTQTPAASGECVRNFDENVLKTAKVDIKNKTVSLEFKDYGTVQIKLYDQDAPKTVENFLRLTNSGYYDCLTVHRVAKGFVIQMGDPNGNGTGGTSAFGVKFNDELNANTPSYKAGYVKGVVAMANSGPNTNGSQFFITLGDLNANLPKNYTIFGIVTSGMDVVEKIGNVAINPGAFGGSDGAPQVPVIIKKALIGK